MKIDQKEIDMFTEYFKKSKELIGKRKSAYLTKKPKEIVVAIMFSQGVKDTALQIKIFLQLKVW